MHGWIVLDKPRGLGSTQAVSAVKRAFRAGGHGKVKVGHGGTLDPLATGVLPIAIGEATKLAGSMLDASKAYDFTIGFGAQTDTLDLEGTEIATSDVRPTIEKIEAVLPRFTGLIEQMPPAFSALRVDGKRAYDLAREGETVVLATRLVTVHSLRAFVASCAESDLARSHEVTKEEVTLSATVSKGTYIRSLARDIALALGTVGHVTMLRRTRAGPFGLADAISLDKLDEAAKGGALGLLMLPIEAGLDGIPALPLAPEQAVALKQGRVLCGIAVPDGLYLAKLGDTPIALVEAKDREVRVERGFNL